MQKKTLSHVIDEEIRQHPERDYRIIKEKINDAYTLLEQMICKQKFTEKHKDKYINRAIEIAFLMSTWGLEYQYIIAGLLHVLPINKICSIDDLKPNVEPQSYAILTKYLSLYTVLYVNNKKIEAKIIKTSYKRAFYVEAAVRIQTLSVDDTEHEDLLSYIQNTKEVFLPLAKEIHAYYIANKIEEVCFQLEHKEEFSVISREFNNWEIKTRKYRQLFLNNLETLLSGRSETNNALTLINTFKQLVVRPRFFHSIYNFATMLNKNDNDMTKLQEDLKKVNNYYRVAFYDLFIILDDTIDKQLGLTKTNIFLTYYDKVLRTKNMYIYGYHYSDEDGSYYFLISDPMKNMYRLFIQLDSEYKLNTHGNILADETNDSYVSKVPSENIKVFDINGLPITIEKGASVLDFAFKVREDYGLYFETAHLNHNRDIDFPVSTILNNGDTVEIIKSDLLPTAKIQWFRYVKTENATNKLINYFKYKLEEPEGKITVITKNGSDHQIKRGMTVLDFAFLVHKEVGLHFDYARINNKDTKTQAHYVLQNLDEVVVYTSEQIKANYNWFNHVTTRKAIKTLIEYFKDNDIKK